MITATLKNVTLDPIYKIVWGNIYGDIHGRWPDGTRIHTSSIPKFSEIVEGKTEIIKTLNSTYRLEWLTSS